MPTVTLAQTFHDHAPSLVVVFSTVFYCTAMVLIFLTDTPEVVRYAAGDLAMPPGVACWRPGVYSWSL
jgi:hypothetical protein